jgi:redox-sensitive bicupin YhaK (pirin superfamily)
MNAGMGIIHSERPPLDIHERGSRQEIIQMWVNTPAADKMNQPEYHPLSAESTPSIKSADGKISVNVITGNVFGLAGPVPTPSEVDSATLHAEIGGKIRIDVPENHEVFLYLLDGKIMVEGYGLAE